MRHHRRRAAAAAGGLPLAASCAPPTCRARGPSPPSAVDGALHMLRLRALQPVGGAAAGAARRLPWRAARCASRCTPSPPHHCDTPVASPQQFLVPPVTNGLAVALSSMVRSVAAGREGGVDLVACPSATWLQGAPPTSCLCLPPQDPTATSADALTAQMMQQLGYSYDGNRAPMEIAIHSPWWAGQGRVASVGCMPTPRCVTPPRCIAPATCRLTSADRVNGLTNFIRQVGPRRPLSKLASMHAAVHQLFHPTPAAHLPLLPGPPLSRRWPSPTCTLSPTTHCANGWRHRCRPARCNLGSSATRSTSLLRVRGRGAGRGRTGWHAAHGTAHGLPNPTPLPSAERAPCTAYTVKAGDSLWWVLRRQGGSAVGAGCTCSAPAPLLRAPCA